jgi:excisionase family DNA binding protein
VSLESEGVELLTVDETAKLLKRHPSTIYRRLERGEWTFAWKDGKDWRIEKDLLLEHLRHQPISTRRKDVDQMPSLGERRARFRAMMADGRRA